MFPKTEREASADSAFSTAQTTRRRGIPSWSALESLFAESFFYMAYAILVEGASDQHYLKTAIKL